MLNHKLYRNLQSHQHSHLCPVKHNPGSLLCRGIHHYHKNRHSRAILQCLASLHYLVSLQYQTTWSPMRFHNCMSPQCQTTSSPMRFHSRMSPHCRENLLCRENLPCCKRLHCRQYLRYPKNKTSYLRRHCCPKRSHFYHESRHFRKSHLFPQS